MKWTTQLPTEPGYYWNREYWNPSYPIGIVRITRREDGKLWQDFNGSFERELLPANFSRLDDETELELWERAIKGENREDWEIIFWCRIPEPEIPN